jgi:ABC-2 type transport system permease protein
MLSTMKAEVKKLLTVRSTYVLCILSFLVLILFAFYIEGLRTKGVVMDPNKLASETTNAITTVTVLGALAGVLLITHEYRYNTIMYTLTAARSRSRVFVAKFLVVTIFALLFSLAVGALSPALTYLGLHIKGAEITPQQFPVWDLAWRTFFYGWGQIIFAFLLAVIIRSQVGAIVALFVVPTLAEQLLTLLLKQNAIYSPFNLLKSVVNDVSLMPGVGPGEAALYYLGYMAILGIIAWALFCWRDAN